MSKKKSYVPVGKVKNHLRRIHGHCPQRRIVKNRAKVDVSTERCEMCDTYLYYGTMEKRFDELKDKYGQDKVIKGKGEVDHIIPVVDEVQGWQGFDEYINRLWVSADEMRNLCKACHAKITSDGMTNRKEKGSLKRKKNEDNG